MDKKPKSQRMLTLFAVTIPAVVGYWFFIGYRYFLNSGVEVVPIIKRLLDPTYLPNDYYLNLIESSYNHRLVFTQIIAAFSQLIGSVEVAMVIVFVMALFFALWGLAKISSDWTRWPVFGSIGLVLATLFGHFVVTHLSPGAVTLFQGELTANFLARALLVWSLYMALKGQVTYSGSFILAAAFVQPLDALLASPLIFLAMAVEDRANSLAFFDRSAIAKILFFGSVLVLVVLGMNLQAFGSGQEEDLFVTLAEGRLSHHYDIQVWPISKWVFLAGFGVAGVYSLFALNEKALAQITLIVGAIFAVYAILFLLTRHPLLFKLQGAKILWLNYIVWSLALSYLLVDKFYGVGSLLLGRFRLIISISGIILIFSISGIAGYRLLPSQLTAVIAFKLTSIFNNGNYLTAIEYADSSELELSRWLKENTKPSAVILHPPELQFVRAIAERSSVVQNKLSGFSNEAIRQWLQRKNAVKNYCQLGHAELNKTAVKFHASFIAVPKNCVATKSVETSFQVLKYWVLYKVNKI